MDKSALLVWLVREARSQGARASEFYYQRLEKTKINVSRGKLENLTRAVEEGLGIRIEAGGGAAFSFSASLKKSDLRRLIRSTIDASNILANPGFSVIPERFAPKKPYAGLSDTGYDTYKLEDKIHFAREMEREALQTDPRIVSVDNSIFEEERDDTLLINSEGFLEGYQSTLYSGVAVCVAKSAHSGAIGYDYRDSRLFAGLNASEIGRSAGRQTVFSLDGVSIESKKISVVMSPYAAGDFMRLLFSAFSGDLVFKKRTFLWNMEGGELGSSHLTIIDDGTEEGATGTVPFDDEGMPAQKTVLVDRGIISQFIHSTLSARRAGKRPTGNQFRTSYRNLPAIHSTNLILKPGTADPQKLISDAVTGLYVNSLTDTGGFNTGSGDFSLAASGRWIDHGELSFPVDSITISGKITEALKNIVAMGNDTLRRGGISSSSILFSEMNISGR